VKKILTMVFPDDKFYFPYAQGANAPSQYYYPSFIPRPSVGKWQLRDMYVFDNRRIPSQERGYCYGNRVIFLDKEQFAPQWLDLFDGELKYWKFYWNLYRPGLIPETGEHTFGSGTSGGFALMQEFQNTHEDAAWQIPHTSSSCSGGPMSNRSATDLRPPLRWTVLARSSARPTTR
jgi:hypothetical protein